MSGQSGDSLTARLAESLRRSLVQEDTEPSELDPALAGRLAWGSDDLELVSAPDPEPGSDEAVRLADEQSDAHVEQMLREAEKAKMSATALVRLWLDAEPPARELALSVLAHSMHLSRDATALSHDDHHRCEELVLCCQGCFADVSEVLPDRTRQVIARLSQVGPLSEVERLELSADHLIDALVSRAQREARSDPDLGTLTERLARLVGDLDR